MGFIFSKHMNDNLKSQQDFMLMNSRLQVTRTPATMRREVTRGQLSPQKQAYGFTCRGLLSSQG